MTPTREQLIEDIAGKLWRDLCEGEGQHSEALDKSLIRKHMDRLAACLAAPPQATPEPLSVEDAHAARSIGWSPEPQAMPPIEVGDWVCAGGWIAEDVKNVAEVKYWRREYNVCRIVEIRKANGTVWTREPRR